jgi:hypothetical protein
MVYSELYSHWGAYGCSVQGNVSRLGDGGILVRTTALQHQQHGVGVCPDSGRSSGALSGRGTRGSRVVRGGVVRVFREHTRWRGATELPVSTVCSHRTPTGILLAFQRGEGVEYLLFGGKPCLGIVRIRTRREFVCGEGNGMRLVSDHEG